MTKEELAEEWVEKEYDELRYEKCERKDFIFTYYELKEMGKQAFLAGLKSGKDINVFTNNTDTLKNDLERITELEKENAALKKRNLNDCKNFNKAVEKIGEQLNQTTEIIRKFVEWANWQGSGCPNFKSIQDKAEQYLKDLGR